jgi:hypothetical protein
VKSKRAVMIEALESTDETDHVRARTTHREKRSNISAITQINQPKPFRGALKNWTANGTSSVGWRRTYRRLRSAA